MSSYTTQVRRRGYLAVYEIGKGNFISRRLRKKYKLDYLALVRSFKYTRIFATLEKTEIFYEACPESKDTKVLNVYNIFNLQKRHCE
jgi:hypothetical protein